MNSSDILIIGAGPGGYETAARARALGQSVTLIERDELGGTCLNRGCIPTKTLCRAAEVARTVASAGLYGISAGVPAVDYAAVSARKDAVVRELRDGVEQVLSGVNIIRGEAVFEDLDRVRVGSDIYTAPRIVVATGSAPAMIPIQGAEYALTSDGALAMTSLPEAVTIIGAGVIGMEFASVFADFGCKVTVVEAAKEILPPFDAEVAKRLRMSMKRRGVEIVTGASVTAITPDGEVLYSAKGKSKTVPPATVIMAVGRRAVIPSGLVEAGVRLTSRGYIETDERMCAARKGSTALYAIGDVNGRCMLAHAAVAQGEVVLGEREVCSPVPSAVFTHPEAAMTGLTEEQCVAQGVDFKVLRATFMANGKARAMGEPEGMVKMIVSESDGGVLGCHIVGPHASDLIAEANLAITSGLPYTAIRASIHPHPTLCEIMRDLH